MSTRARILMEPRPVSYASRIPSRPMMRPAVGKSGPRTFFMSSLIEMSGFSIVATTASMTSPRLCGGMFVAMPTAIPCEPLTSRFGSREGSTTGSCSYPSKLGTNSTVSLSMSRRSSIASGARRASVYRIAPAGSPSIEPKFPCGSISG